MDNNRKHKLSPKIEPPRKKQKRIETIKLNGLSSWQLSFLNMRNTQIFSNQALQDESHWIRSIEIGSAIEFRKGEEAIWPACSNDFSPWIVAAITDLFIQLSPRNLSEKDYGVCTLYLTIKFDMQTSITIDLNTSSELTRLRQIPKQQNKIIYGFNRIHVQRNKIGQWRTCLRMDFSDKCVDCKRDYCSECFPERMRSLDGSYHLQCRYCLLNDRNQYLLITIQGIFYSLFDRKRRNIDTNIVNLIQNFVTEKDLRCSNEIKVCKKLKNIHHDPNLADKRIKHTMRSNPWTDNTWLFCVQCCSDKQTQDGECKVYHDRDGTESRQCVKCGTLECNRCNEFAPEYVKASSKCVLCGGYLCEKCRYKWGRYMGCDSPYEHIDDGRYCDLCIASKSNKDIAFCIEENCNQGVCKLCRDECRQCQDKELYPQRFDSCICGGSGLKYLTDGINVPCDECDEGEKYDSGYCTER